MRQTNRLALVTVFCLFSAASAAPPADGAETKGSMYGDTRNARRIVFLCDAAGSMINKMPALKKQLGNAVNGLTPAQSFDVIFFRNEGCESFAKSRHIDGLAPATPEMKKAFAGKDGFLDGVETSGSEDPIPGIEAAFKSAPDTIYLLTDGDFPDNDAVLKKIAMMDKDHKVKINTIAFTSADDNDNDFLELLKKIAKDSGGVYKHVKERDLE